MTTRPEKPLISASFPNLFLVGAPKCGTTSVATVLARHPDIRLGATKEPWYLNTDFGPRYITDQDEYIRHFAHEGPRPRYLCDASTTYLYSDAARQAIAALPHSMVLIMVRHPVDMALSWHAQKRLTLEEDVDSFEDAWRLIPDRRNGERLPKRLRERRWILYDEMAALGTVCHKWIDDLGTQRVKVLLLNEMQEHPTAFFECLFAFLNLASEGGLDCSAHLNRRARPRSLLLARILANAARLKNRLLPAAIGGNVLSRLQALNSAEFTAGAISASFEAELNEHFADEVNLLEELTGVSLNQ